VTAPEPIFETSEQGELTDEAISSLARLLLDFVDQQETAGEGTG